MSRVAGQSRVAHELQVAVMRLARRLRAERGDHGLTLTQLACLATLHRHGAMTPSDLAAHEKVQPPSMTRTINGLAERGLVHRAPDPTDGRQVVVSLTDDGRDLLATDRAQREQWLTQRLVELTPEDRDTLARANAILDRLAGS
jgi:DNA-binding MarR family transcriptional regulator